MVTLEIPTSMKVWLLLLALTAASAFAQDAVMRSGDEIVLRLGGVPPEEISQVSGNYQVDGQGFLNLPHIGKIKAEGVTQGDLQTSIETAYRSKQIYTNPTITINVPTAARFVNVAGQVKNPRRVEFTPDLTVFSAITACGGFTDYADQKKIQFTRDGKRTVINFKDLRAGKVPDERLRPGDSIEVPMSPW